MPQKRARAGCCQIPVSVSRVVRICYRGGRVEQGGEGPRPPVAGFGPRVALVLHLGRECWLVMGAYDVFISYSHEDKPVADAACAVLERHGVRCWIAPRDVTLGMNYGESIMDAIEGARIMVLVFSDNANNSPQVEREIERAVSKGLWLIPIRIEDVVPRKSLEYFISSSHWLDAITPPMEQHLDRLAEAVRTSLASVDKPSTPLPRRVSPPPRQDPPLQRAAVTLRSAIGSKRNLLIALLVVLLAAS